MKRLTIPGKPVAKQSFKFTRGGRRYTEKHVTDYKTMVAYHGTQAFHRPFEGPLEVRILGYWPSRKPDRKKVPRPAERKATKPDADNLAKSVLDGLNGIAFLDDAQVVRLVVETWHAAQGDPPRVEVEVGSVA